MSTKYLKYVPKTLQEDFINNTVIPIVGAGFSKNATLPEGAIMPDWNELGKIIASYITDYDYLNPLDALSLFEAEYSRVKLIEIMAKELHVNEITPSDTYRAFCSVFFETICTTNFDFVIDQWLSESNRPHSIIVSQDRIPISINETTKLIKLHGDFNHPDNMVITEHDYDEFLEKNKILSTYVSNLFITKTIFLVGYSFDDADIRGLWQIINSRLGKLSRLAYCVMVDASKTEIARFERRNVKVINLPGKKSEYPNILKIFFEEIKELIDNNTPKRMIATNERAIEELLLPNISNRLCFISAPISKIPFLKEILYPVLLKQEITPISLDEVILPGDNWMMKSEALIKKSFLAVVDLSGSSSNVLWELSALEGNKKNIVLISDEKSSFNLPFSVQENKMLLYNSSNSNDFIINFEDAIFKFSQGSDFNNMNEAQRLLKKNEYAAAMVAAFRILEKTLRETCYKNNNNTALNLSQMLKKLTDNNQIQLNYDEVKDLIHIRNNIVHSNISVSKSEASELVKRVEKLIGEISNSNTIPNN